MDKQLADQGKQPQGGQVKAPANASHQSGTRKLSYEQKETQQKKVIQSQRPKSKERTLSQQKQAEQSQPSNQPIKPLQQS